MKYFYIVLFLSFGNLYGQLYEKNQILISGSYGLIQTRGAVTRAGFNAIAEDYNAKVNGPFYIMAEYLVSPKMGVGINLANITLNSNYTRYDSSRNEYTDGTYRYSSSSALLRLNFHLSKSKNLDVYMGVGIGVRTNTHRLKDNGSVIPEVLKPYLSISWPGPGMDCTLGFRYFASPEFAFYLETGMAKSLLRIGMSYRLTNINKSVSKK